METQSTKKLIALVMFSFNVANAQIIPDVNPNITQGYAMAFCNDSYKIDHTLSTNFTVDPNPFSNATNITFTLDQSEKVSMWIIDLKGVFIKSMLNDYLDAGDYLIQCNSENLKAGIYFLQTKTGETLATEKLIVTK